MPDPGFTPPPWPTTDVWTSSHGERLRSLLGIHPVNRTEFAMLWTILIVLAVIALAIFIVSRIRGRSGL